MASNSDSKYILEFITTLTPEAADKYNNKSETKKHYIYADTYKDAMNVYCTIPAIQDLSMEDVMSVEIKSTPNKM